MAYYSYYQHQSPHWGQQAYANQYSQQLIQPPVPTYQPQPSWRGQDFYRAHYSLGNNGAMDSSDIGLFDYVWSRLKGFVGSGGVGREEARHWHGRVYGGMVDITTLLPSDLGAAAGYEAMRLFKYHKSVYRQPLMDDREREEEALAGLAIAEATKLWSYCQRPGDKYGRRETCEVAAATAERLLRRSRRHDRHDRDHDEYETSSYNGSYGSHSGYGSSSEEDDYRRHRKHRRRSSASYGTMMPAGIGSSGYVGAGVGSMPGYASRVTYPAVSGAVSGAPYYAGQPTYGGVGQAAYGGVAQPAYGAAAMPGYQYAGGAAGVGAGAVGGLIVPQTRTRHGSFSSYGGGAPVYPTY